MKTVLFFKSSELYSGRQKIAGVTAVAREEGWNVQFIEAIDSTDELTKLLAMWKPDGCIVSGGALNNIFPSALLKPTPTVFIDRPAFALSATDSCVYHDSTATATLAAKELLSLNLPHYAYANWPVNLTWNRERRAAFVRLLSNHGHTPLEFQTTEADYRDRDFPEVLRSWLMNLPKPIGILAAADQLASKIVSACSLAGLSIPEDVALIGIDNDADLCESTNPTLSSVAPDFYAAGRLAAEQLARLMASRKTKPLRCTYPPRGIVRRASTRRLQQTEPSVTAALELIRLKACDGLTSKDVLPVFLCSRRMAEIRFRKFTGHSIQDEILAVRLQKAKELLSGPSLKLEAIANFCGYKSSIAFSLFFKRCTGQSPTAWRDAQTPSAYS